MAEVKTETNLKETKTDTDLKDVKSKADSIDGKAENGDSKKIEASTEKKPAISKAVENGTGAVSELESKIIEQIEYYFGDCNLPRDRFLQEQIKLDDGWVPLEVMIKFNRLAKLTTDLDAIVVALKKSKTGLLEINEESKKIRRDPSHVLPEMNEARRQELMQRTLYVKGFPAEGVELDMLLKYFAKYGKVDQLVMRKYHDKAEKKWIFKGSVFAVFPTKEEAEKFLKLENLKYEDTDLIKKWQIDYVEEKKNERLQSKLDNQNKKRKLREDKDDEDGDEEDKKDGLAKGAALYLSDCSSELTREEVKSKIEEFGIGVAYLYFSKGDTEGWVRLQEAGSAAEVVKNLKEGKLEFDGYSVSVRALEGDEETKFLERVKDDMSKRRNHNKNNRGRKGRGGGGGRNYSFGRKRRGSPVRYGNNKSNKGAAEAKSD